MINYIKGILPRLQRYSQQLDNIEMFVGKPWVLVDESSNTHEYEFDRGGRLIMAINGDVIEGKWEYRIATNRLLIDRGGADKILLQHAFISNGVMVLKKSGTEEIPFLLYNRNVILDGNIQKYLDRFLESNGLIPPPETPLFEVTYKTNRGEITIFQKELHMITGGDAVRIDGSPALNAVYSFEGDPYHKLINVIDGEVVSLVRKP